MKENSKIVTDPANSMKVRFTDNRAKDGDFYPEDQEARLLALDPAGTPYTLLGDLGVNDLGDGEALS